MNLVQIRYVLEAGASSSMREASRKLLVSEPALSSGIKDLEEEIGIRLFERSNRGISLTDDGKEFSEYAGKVLAQYELLEARYLSKGNRENDNEYRL